MVCSGSQSRQSVQFHQVQTCFPKEVAHSADIVTALVLDWAGLALSV